MFFIYWSLWKDLFLTAVAECVPIESFRETNSPPWIDREVRFAIRRKYRALRKYCENKTVERRQKLRLLSIYSWETCQVKTSRLSTKERRLFERKLRVILELPQSYFTTSFRLGMKSPSMEEQQKLLLKKLCFLILISALCLHHLRRLEPTTYTLIPGERLRKFRRLRFLSVSWVVVWLIWMYHTPLVPTESLRVFLRSAASRSPQVFVHY